jgi:hypothetical protein
VSHHIRAFDSAVAYHLHTTDGLTTSSDHLIAAALAAAVADAEYNRAAAATTRREQQMFLHAATKASAVRDYHHLAGEITAIGEQAQATG